MNTPLHVFLTLGQDSRRIVEFACQKFKKSHLVHATFEAGMANHATPV